VRAAAARRPGHPAVETPSGALTYAELDAAADVAARRLAALGVGGGDRVATTLAPGLEFAALLHALPRLGAALVPLNTRLPAAAQRRQAELARVSLTVDEPLENGFEFDVPAGHRLDPGAVHTVLFTSGTSGEPKPVELTVGNHEASAAGSAALLGSEPGDRWLCPLPLFHIGGLGILLRSARAATTAVLHPRFETARVLEGLAAGHYTLASVVSTQVRRLRDAGLQRAPGLRTLVMGGGPVPPDLLDWARGRGIPVRSTYGMTETTSQVAVTGPWEVTAEPVPGAELAIGEQREILVRGPMVSPGAVGSDGWLHTGDLGTIGRDGLLRVEGRLTELIVTGGENVAPAVVEAALLAHPGIADAGVGGTPDPEWGEAVTAYVVERRPVSDYELLSFARERLAGYQVPKRVVRVRGLPRNAGGKLLRAELAASEPPPGR
jgi:O-succinylbenzoic acid--CoA ligase